MDLKQLILSVINDKQYKPLSFKEFAYLLDVHTNKEKNKLKEVLSELENSAVIIFEKNRYARPKEDSILKGLLRINSGGYGFVLSNKAEDIYIPSEELAGALSGDEVLAQITRENKPHNEGRILKILKNNNKVLTGTILKTKRGAYIRADNKGIFRDVYVSDKNTLQARNKNRVLFEIIQKKEQGRLEGRVVEVLGSAANKGADIKSVLINNAIKYTFNDEAADQAERIILDISTQEIKKRIDLSGENIFTIDALTAKDMDDAVSIKKNKDNYILGVHIADVSHYVKKNTPLDREALERGNSVYFPDYAVPMLPYALSSELCSLKEGQKRLTVSVIMTVDKLGNIKNYEIFKSIIQSKKKMTYTGVQAVLDSRVMEDEEYKNFKNDIFLMDELCDILNQQRRKKRGSIDFDMPEAEAIIDENGWPQTIKKAERLKSHKIIEEFMLLANETVAEHIFWLNYPCIYRTHENPEAEKLSALKEVLFSMGYKINIMNMHPRRISELLENIADKPEEDLIKNIILRSMQRAVYQNKNLGHFGIAAKYYTHFTSPIRRYADLIVHRVLSEILKNNTENELLYSNEQLAEISAHISRTERNAMKAERDVMRIKMAKYLSDKIGAEYRGVISYITINGFFVELDNLIEGFVPFSYLDEYYISDVKRFLFFNEQSKKVYKMGQIIGIKVTEVDINEGRCIFIMTSDEESKKR
jgi:ribonuclease R